MAGYPKDFPNQQGMGIGVIAGGDITDPPSDQSSNQKVFLPMEHKDGSVSLDHLAFSPLHHSPTNHSQQAFPGALDPGSLVYVLKVTGQNQVTILGQANDFNNASKNRTPGNIDLMSGQTIQELLNRKIKIWIPPDVEDKEIKGAKVKVPKEKGKEHYHNLSQGLPTHLAMFQMAGYRLPQVKEIPTALQHYNNLLTNDDMGGMGGDLMSLGKMFQGLMGGLGGGGGGGGGAGQGQVNNSQTGDVIPGSINTSSTLSASELIDQASSLVPNANSAIPMERIISRLPDPKLADAIINLAILTQGGEWGGSLGSFVTNQRADMPTVIENAEELFSQVTCFADIMHVMQTISSNEDLYGQEKLPPVISTIETADGTATKYFHANGYISIFGDSVQQNTDNVFANAVSSGTQNYGAGDSGGGAGGGGGGGAPSGSGQNMFGDMGKNLMDMLKRVSPKAEKAQKKCINNCNTSQQGKKIQKHVDANIKGQDPISPQLFD